MKYPVKFEIGFKKHKNKGKLIALEGNEGSGKTTQAKDLVVELKKQKIKAVYTKEPTNSPIGQMIQQVLFGELKVPPISLQYLFCADRAIHQEEVEKYLEKGYVVVTDRYFWSAIAYGMAKMNKSADYYSVAYSILSFYDQFISPDITFFLDVDVDVAFKRISKSEKHNSIFDKRNTMSEVGDTYAKLIKKFPEEFAVIDANKAQSEVLAELLEKTLANKS